jgi:hypothetical protein
VSVVGADWVPGALSLPFGATYTAPLVGEVVGDGVGLAVVRLGVGEAAVGVAVPVATLPVHAVPLSANDAGTGLLPVHEPLNPNEVLALVPSAPL